MFAFHRGAEIRAWTYRAPAIHGCATTRRTALKFEVNRLPLVQWFSTFSSMWPNRGSVAHRLYNFSNATTVAYMQFRSENNWSHLNTQRALQSMRRLNLLAQKQPTFSIEGCRRHSRQIHVCRQRLYSCDLLPCWLRSKVAGVAYWWTYMHQLLLPKLVKVTLGGIFVKEFCYTSGNHASIWANFCSPSKTTNVVQIAIGLPERASKNMQLSTWTLTNFKFK